MFRDTRHDDLDSELQEYLHDMLLVDVPNAAVVIGLIVAYSIRTNMLLLGKYLKIGILVSIPINPSFALIDTVPRNNIFLIVITHFFGLLFS